MKTIICPNCNKHFELENPAYFEIMEQVRRIGFNEQLEVIEREKKLEYELKLRDKDEEIARLTQKFTTREHDLENELSRLKDFKQSLSTKNIGESLEQYCFTEFQKIRSLFPNATFEKDNTPIKGEGETKATKGDFIYRESIDGVELISIMFEMKHEGSTGNTKNEKHFKKLHEDREKKNCEYAVLVTTLEPDSDYYNTGIVDLSHVYSKMYAVRPEHFIQIITILRNAALNALDAKKRVAELEAEKADIKAFEGELGVLKAALAKNYKHAIDRNISMVDEIENIIKTLRNIQEEIRLQEKDLKCADDKINKISLKKLAKNSPRILEDM